MITFHIITIFPEIFDSYFSASILARAQSKKLIKIKIYDLRKFTNNKHNKVDGKPYGGGPGMVMYAEPIVKAVNSILKTKKNSKVILFSPVGREFNQKKAIIFSKKHKNIILVAGRYEGIDERVKKILKAEEFSTGPYILTGGEIPSMTLVDAISRQIPGVLGDKKSLEENRGMGIPSYARPEIFKYKGKSYKVPKVLVSGDHKKIEEWRKSKQFYFSSDPRSGIAHTAAKQSGR